MAAPSSVVARGEIQIKNQARRDFFAAQAPVDPLWLFEPDTSSIGPRPTPIVELSDRGMEYIANEAEIRAWDDRRDSLVAAQWPWQWADAVLAADKLRRSEPPHHQTLECYLRNGIEFAGIIDYQLRASVSHQTGQVAFYIHPDSRDGDTFDFIVEGNRLKFVKHTLPAEEGT